MVIAKESLAGNCNPLNVKGRSSVEITEMQGVHRSVEKVGSMIFLPSSRQRCGEVVGRGVQFIALSINGLNFVSLR